MQSDTQIQSPRLIGYLAWVNAWLENPRCDNSDISSTSLDDLVNIFRQNTLP